VGNDNKPKRMYKYITSSCINILPLPHTSQSNIGNISCNYEQIYTLFSGILYLLGYRVISNREKHFENCYPLLGQTHPTSFNIGDITCNNKLLSLLTRE